MLEFVYGERAGTRAARVARARRKAAEEADKAASWAAHNALTLELGYTASGNRWPDDEDAPTRLGEPTVTLRLCRVEGDRLIPWDTSGPVRLRWARSDVTVRQAMVASVDSGWVSERWIAASREEMSDGGRLASSSAVWDQRILDSQTARLGPEKGRSECYSHEKGMWFKKVGH